MAPHGRYFAVHTKPSGAGDARPTALDIIRDEHLEGKLTDKTIVITGCSAGIGIETARALAVTGAKLFLTARDLSKATSALSGILDPSQYTLIQMDQMSLASVRAAAKDFLAQSQQLNILICNAGIMALPQRTLTEDGHEAQFGVNHLSHFLLIQLLRPTLLASSTPSFHSRVVMVSSSAHRRSDVHFSDYTCTTEGSYAPFTAYGASKSANIYTANAISSRYDHRGLHGLSLHPGGISSGLQQHVDEETKAAWAANPGTEKWSKSAAQGAGTSVCAAVGREWEGRGGLWLEDCDEGYAEERRPYEGMSGWVGYVWDKSKGERLWRDSCEMVGMVDKD